MQDLLVDPIVGLGLFPIVLPLVVDEYVNLLWAPDLQSLSNETLGRNYTGISAVKELTAFTVAVTEHIQQRHHVPFGVVFTEMCGQSRANLTARSGRSVLTPLYVQLLPLARPSSSPPPVFKLSNAAWLTTGV